MDAADRERCARKLVSWLRHKPAEAGLALADGGWAAIGDLAQPLLALGLISCEADIAEVLSGTGSLRFDVRSGLVRARYGHSVDTRDSAPPEAPPARLYCAVRRRRMPAMLLTGLKPVKRTHVSLAVRLSTARLLVEANPEDTAVMLVDAAAAAASGVRFYARGCGIWLSDAVAREFLKPVGGNAPEPQAARSPARTGPARGGARRRRIIRKPRGEYAG